MDRIKEVGKEGTCSECQEEKMIIACQDGEVFCQDCFDKKPQNESENER